MRDNGAQPDDRAFELFERGRIVSAAHEINPLREPIYRQFKAREAFSRSQAAQDLAHFREPALEIGDCVVIHPSIALRVDARRQRADLALQCLEGLPRHRLFQKSAHFGEFVADALDQAIHRARPHRFDPARDLAKLLFEF